MGVLIIAEAGVNHNGSLDIAKKMVDAAVIAGVDIIKFQTFKAEKLVTKSAVKAKYQQVATDNEESQLSMLKKLELTEEEHQELIKYCKEKEILFLSTAFDLESLALLERFSLPMYKVPSGEITNLPYLIKIAQTGKPIILSSGMSTMEELKAAVKVLLESGAGIITILHCNTEYPTPFVDVNLRAMLTIAKEFGVDVGYSDHTQGIEIPIAAVALGAKVIEKHFTLDRSMEGPDHKASLEPEELNAMVTAIRHVEQALGSEVKQPSPSEAKNIAIARKSIVAKKVIKKGELFDDNNLTTKRPGNGISPMQWFDVIGTRAVKDFEEDEMIIL